MKSVPNHDKKATASSLFPEHQKEDIAMEDKVCASIDGQSWSGTVDSGRGSDGGASNRRKKKFAAPRCNCGAYAILFQSSTSSNPDRLFFGCSNFKVID
ncbi:hypothetical protein PIB30_055115 [Stylosanthes scabra]|uniref:Zinc finger GRF-type domain-containing protein n=1 Tax=Stylosanthes scabra TaxID=79078 RepID=A0ABU6UKK8_9FABA|nr:hypothetical protein [Stylosanthes scabra]